MKSEKENTQAKKTDTPQIKNSFTIFKVIEAIKSANKWLIKSVICQWLMSDLPVSWQAGR